MSDNFSHGLYKKLIILVSERRVAVAVVDPFVSVMHGPFYLL
jgi:RecA-family ATPase